MLINLKLKRYAVLKGRLLIPIILPFLVYIIFLVAPKIDPKNKLSKMGNKFQTLKILMTVFMSLLALFIIYSSKNQFFTNTNHIVLLIGVLYIILGNYFKTIKANYFIGIRTPWTLENETIWKETHKLGGKLWSIGGIITVLSSLTLNNQASFTLFLVITGIITIIPIAYSYILFKKEKTI